jgi:4-azaleucine resistance transporter AzlC
MHTKSQAFKAALPYTLPICAGFSFLGLAYGIYMNSLGFSFVYPMVMSLTIFAGSMEFVAANLMMTSFDPVTAFALALMVNARHLFYGVSMIDKFRGTGKKKIYLIFGMCDESFSINCTAVPPEGVDRGWFMFFVTLLNHAYWFLGATLGGLLGSLVTLNTRGIDFVLVALFVVIFLDQWMKPQPNDAARDRGARGKRHAPALIGLLASVVCLVVFGAQQFILPAMALILIVLTVLRKPMSRRKEDGTS